MDMNNVKVSELIAHLQTLDPNARVKVWDGYYNRPTGEVKIQPIPGGAILIAAA